MTDKFNPSLQQTRLRRLQAYVAQKEGIAG